MFVLEKDNRGAQKAAVAEASRAAQPRTGRDRGWLIGLAIALTVVFAVTVAFVLSPQNMQLAALFDSGEYLRSTASVVRAIRDVLQEGNWQVLMRNCHMLSAPLMLDGPILPSLGAAYYLMIGKTPDVLDMAPALVLQAVLHTMSALLVGLIARRLMAAVAAPAVAALVWGLYPSAIVASGRFLSETMATVLLCSAILAAISIAHRAPQKGYGSGGSHNTEGLDNGVGSHNTAGSYNGAGSHNTEGSRSTDGLSVWSAVLGFSCAALSLTKPALAPVAMAIVAIAMFRRATLWHFDRLVPTVILSVCGAAIVLIPWLSFTFLATGQCQITPQRMPAKNFVVGANPETDGWGAIPETPFCKLFDERDSVLPIALSRFQSDGPGMVNLCVRKIARLWGQPWNDCRNKVIGLAAQHQIWYHYFLLAGCALAFAAGSAVALLKGSGREKSSSALTTFLHITIAALIGHLVYTLFVATSRYGFTVMPLISLWCASALFVLTRLSRSRILLALSGIALVLLSCRIDITSMCLAAGLSSDVSATVGLMTQLILLCAGAVALHTSTVPPARESLQASDWQVAPIFARANVSLLAMFATAISLLAANASCPGQIHAWQTRVTAGDTVTRTFTLPGDFLQRTYKGEYAVVFDGSAEGVSVKLNGHVLTAKVVPLYEQMASKELQDDYLIFATVVHKEPAQLNMWRAVAVPQQMLRPGDNTIELSTSSQAYIVGDYLPPFSALAPRIVSPDFKLFSPTYLLNNMDTLEPRLPARLPPRIASGVCSRADGNGIKTSDLSDWPGTQSGQYRLYFATIAPESNVQESKAASSNSDSRTASPKQQISAGSIAVF